MTGYARKALLMMYSIKVALAEDHDAYRAELVKLLRSHDFLLTCDTKNGLFTRTLHPFLLPDIAIINYKTRRPETLNAARWLREAYPKVRIVISTLFPFHLPENEFKALGIDGVIIKSQQNADSIIEMLQRVYKGEGG